MTAGAADQVPTAGQDTTADLTPRARAKRSQIRAAAQELFLQHGFEATTMDSVTARAGISKQTLYRYYSSKEVLFADILDQLTLQRGPAVDWPPTGTLQLTSRTDLEAMLIWLARDIVTDTMHPTLIALMRVMIAEVPRFPHLKDLFRATISGPGFAAVTRMFETAQAAGIIDPIDTGAAARLFIGALLTYFMVDGLFAAAEPQPPTDQEIVSIVRLVIRSMTLDSPSHPSEKPFEAR